ncbi:hypothetical protein HAX54_005069, partial [Datura stramonium]|nr:hypothetical protein [Datura stramonium]
IITPVSPIDAGEPSTHTTLFREAKEASKVDEDDSSQEQTESGHAFKGNKYGEDDDGEGDNEDEEDDEDGEGDNENGKGDNEDGKDENNDDDDTNENTTTVDHKKEEENDENVPSTPVEASSSERDPSTTSTEIVVKNIRFENYNLKMLMDVHGELEGDIVVRSSIDLPDDTTPRFQMTMVFSLLRHRIIYDKKDEIWINYCGMPICFGMKEFVVMTGLNCHSPPRVGGAKPVTKLFLTYGIKLRTSQKKCLLRGSLDGWLRRITKQLVLIYLPPLRDLLLQQLTQLFDLFREEVKLLQQLPQLLK